MEEYDKVERSMVNSGGLKNFSDREKNRQTTDKERDLTVKVLRSLNQNE